MSKTPVESPDGKDISRAIGKIRQEVGEGSDAAEFKAEDSLKRAKREALDAENRTEHEGNRANWTE